MSTSTKLNATVECELIGEFTDYASESQPYSETPMPNGEIVPPNILTQYSDDASAQSKNMDI